MDEFIIEAADVFLNGEDSSSNPGSYLDANAYAKTVAESIEQALGSYLYERIDAGDYVREAQSGNGEPRGG